MTKLNEVFQLKEAADPYFLQALQRYVTELQADINDLQSGAATPQEIGNGLINRAIEMKSTGEQLLREK